MPPEAEPALVTLFQVVLVAVIAQAGAAWIGRQQRKTAEAQQAVTLTDSREERVMKEADGLRAELRAEVVALRAALEECQREREALREERRRVGARRRRT
jgi:chromosome segregation ATPase